MGQNIQVKLINKENSMVKEKFNMQTVISSEEFLSMDNVFMRKSHIMTKIIMRDKCSKINFMVKARLKINKGLRKDCSDMGILFLV